MVRIGTYNKTETKTKKNMNDNFVSRFNSLCDILC